MQSALLLRLVLRTQVISRRSLSHLSGDSDERGSSFTPANSYNEPWSRTRSLSHSEYHLQETPERQESWCRW
ncbi:hypothetical protein NPIL_293621, partial [Nephila pilipes]